MSMITEKLTIGKLAKHSDVGVETIRFYEKKSLLKQPQSNGSFRTYPVEYITRIKFIKRSQELGFTLKEVKDLLDLKIKPQSKCSDVLSKTDQKILEIDHKIKDLQRIKKSLVKLANCCEDTAIPLNECPILDCFVEKK